MLLIPSVKKGIFLYSEILENVKCFIHLRYFPQYYYFYKLKTPNRHNHKRGKKVLFNQSIIDSVYVMYRILLIKDKELFFYSMLR